MLLQRKHIILFFALLLGSLPLKNILSFHDDREIVDDDTPTRRYLPIIESLEQSIEMLSGEKISLGNYGKCSAVLSILSKHALYNKTMIFHKKNGKP